jgi:hypothetical protein
VISPLDLKLGAKVSIPFHPQLHPETRHIGRIVWIRDDNRTIAVQCERKHEGKIIAILMTIDPTTDKKMIHPPLL